MSKLDDFEKWLEDRRESYDHSKRSSLLMSDAAKVRRSEAWEVLCQALERFRAARTETEPVIRVPISLVHKLIRTLQGLEIAWHHEQDSDDFVRVMDTYAGWAVEHWKQLEKVAEGHTES